MDSANQSGPSIDVPADEKVVTKSIMILWTVVTVIGTTAIGLLIAMASPLFVPEEVIEVIPPPRLIAPRQGLGEIDTVTLCDLTVKARMVSESSFDSAMEWDYTVSNGKARVVRKFEAQNAFGAMITSRYYCEIDVVTQRVTSLTTDP